MIVFMAGGVSGNCFPLWRELARADKESRLDIYIAGTQGRRWCVDEYISHWNDVREHGTIHERERVDGSLPNIPVAILESFYYADEWTAWIIPRCSRFLLDSGAFTFMENNKKAVDWDEYLSRYIEFINKNDIGLFFELDIDSIVGYERVLDIRSRLERETGKRCIPVWHKSRGRDEFLKMCDSYDYVAIGGIVSGEITRKEYPIFSYLIKEAHSRGAKIHGLGFTNLEGLKKYHFDSVDSTSWTTGNRFGAVYRFDGKTMVKYQKSGYRISDSRALAINNFNEWVKFQHYAESHL